MSDAKLGAFLREVSNWRWDEFLAAENDKSYTSNQSMIFGLVRACAMQKLNAIKLSVNRLDGKLATPIRFEPMRVFYLYPNATIKHRNPEVKLDDGSTAIVITKRTPEEIPGAVKAHKAQDDASDLPSLSLRQTVSKMADYPRSVPDAVVQAALETEMWFRKQGPRPNEIPLVKSVIAGNLHIMAQSRDIDAITEVFDQIDGKLVETIKLGEDMHIVSYISEAPDGAYLNADGVVEIEATASQDMWAQKLGKG